MVQTWMLVAPQTEKVINMVDTSAQQVQPD
jgi:hypothetical protein